MTDAVIKIKAKDSTAKAFGSAKAGLKSVGSMASSVQAQIAGLVGAAGFVALIKVNIETAASTKKVADALNVEVESLSAWRYAIRGTKIDGDKFADQLKDISEKLADGFVTGGGEAVDVIKRLNLNIGEMVKLSPDKQLLKIASALDQVQNHNEKIFLLESLGSDLSLLLPLLDDNAAGFHAMRVEAEQLNAIISTESAISAEQFEQDLEKLKATTNGLALEMGTRMLPALNSISSAMVQAAKDSGVLMALFVGLDGVVTNVLGLEGSESWYAEKEAEKRAAAVAKQRKEVMRLQEAITSQNTVIKVSSGYTTQAREQLELLNKHGYGEGTAQAKIWQDVLKENQRKYVSSSAAVKLLVADLEKLQEEQKKKAPPEIEGGGGSSGGTAPSAADAKAEAEALKHQERLAKQFERLNISLMSEQDRLLFHFEEKALLIDENYQLGLVTEAERNATKEALEAQHHEKLKAIRYKGMSDSDAFATAFRNKDLKSTMQYGAALTSAVAGNNKGLFKANQLFTAANAAMELPGAVMSSFSKAGGFPWGVVPAGITLATGLSQIGAIKSASFGGGGGSPSIPSGGYTPPSVVTTPTSSQTTDVNAGTAQEAPQVLKLEVPADSIFSDESMRNLINRAGEVLQDMPPGSRLVAS